MLCDLEAALDKTMQLHGSFGILHLEPSHQAVRERKHPMEKLVWKGAEGLTLSPGRSLSTFPNRQS